ncbi:hypothetical protein CVS40_12344 [Lucilia cuprina]|nr:hypothetical protein CVS40_12344 [Lucilia cuprina]
MNQLKMLVAYMEENPEFARGTPTWAELKSRPKKKIASSSKSLKETGDGLYRFTALTELEEIIDRTLFLFAATAPHGKTHGYEVFKR